MMSPRSRIALLLLVPIFAINGRATTVERLTVARMTHAAELVARVRTIASEAHWNDGEIWTFTTCEVLELWKGTARSEIRLRLLGGRVGDLISTVHGVPRFLPGEEAILFLEPAGGDDFTVVGWAQGAFRIHRDARSGELRVTQDSAGLAVFFPASREFRAEGVRDVPVEDLRRQVQAAMRGRGGTP